MVFAVLIWYNVTTPEPPYPNWHRDKDEGSEEIILADSCILYLTPHDLWGGFLELETVTRTEVERVAPRFNRCVVLDPCAGTASQGFGLESVTLS